MAHLIMTMNRYAPELVVLEAVDLAWHMIMYPMVAGMRLFMVAAVAHLLRFIQIGACALAPATKGSVSSASRRERKHEEEPI